MAEKEKASLLRQNTPGGVDWQVRGLGQPQAWLASGALFLQAYKARISCGGLLHKTDADWGTPQENFLLWVPTKLGSC